MRFLRRKRHCNACGKPGRTRKVRGCLRYRVCRSCGPFTWGSR